MYAPLATNSAKYLSISIRPPLFPFFFLFLSYIVYQSGTTQVFSFHIGGLLFKFFLAFSVCYSFILYIYDMHGRADQHALQLVVEGYFIAILCPSGLFPPENSHRAPI